MHANAQPTSRPWSSPPRPVSTPQTSTPPIMTQLLSQYVGKRIPSTADAVREPVPSKPTRTRWSPSTPKFHHPRKPPRDRPHLISHHPLTSLSPGRGIRKAAVCAHPRTVPNEKLAGTSHFVGPFARRAVLHPTVWIAFCMRPAGQVCAVVVGNVECAEIGAAAAGLGLVGGCLRLVAAGETSPASGVERRWGAGRALFGWVMGRGNVTGGGCGFGGLGISAWDGECGRFLGCRLSCGVCVVGKSGGSWRRWDFLRLGANITTFPFGGLFVAVISPQRLPFCRGDEYWKTSTRCRFARANSRLPKLLIMQKVGRRMSVWVLGFKHGTGLRIASVH